MATHESAQKRTAWDVILGLVLVVAGIFLLGNAVFATAVSVFVIGWTTLFSGLVLLAASFFRIKSGGFLSAVLGGAILAVIGLFILRNPVVGAVALTLGAGVTFFVSGLTRMAWAFGAEKGRLLFIISGLISLGLGVLRPVQPQHRHARPAGHATGHPDGARGVEPHTDRPGSSREER